jgi:CheY-like chemotaxis protein
VVFSVCLLPEREYFVAVFDVITKRKLDELELIKAKEKAVESDKLKSSFLQNMSHEIRTPLNGIVGFSNFLKEIDSLTAEEINEYIQIILDSSDRLLSIVNDVLEISRLDVGIVNINKSQFQLAEVSHYFYQLYKDKIKSKHLKFIVNFQESIINQRIFTDKDKLYQIISNLINNAIKFTENGEIEFGCKLSENSFLFYFKDTGIGVKPEYLSTIFNRFFQYEAFTTKKYGGTGLGLSICKSLADLLNAKIIVESDYGIGSTFYISFPLSDIFVLENINNISNFLQNEFIDLSNISILIVDDETINYIYLKELLRKQNAEISWAKNGLEALQLVKVKSFNIILMDLKMPIMDGFEATREIKKLKPNIPIIAQTAYSHQDEKQKAINAGCVSFISKPIKTKDLFNNIKYALSIE